MRRLDPVRFGAVVQEHGLDHWKAINWTLEGLIAEYGTVRFPPLVWPEQG